jgi:multicomponent Na+:H+ antiporter subunit C
MELLLALTVGILYAAGLYLLLRRSLVKVIVGLALLTNGANLLIFTAAGLVRGRPPLVEAGESVPRGPFADPVPQALILTAIVIGFGLQAFAMALAYRVYRESGSEDVDSLRTTEDPSISLPKVEAAE